jgi:hypothetical protein
MTMVQKAMSEVMDILLGKGEHADSVTPYEPELGSKKYNWSQLDSVWERHAPPKGTRSPAKTEASISNLIAEIKRTYPGTSLAKLKTIADHYTKHAVDSGLPRPVVVSVPFKGSVYYEKMKRMGEYFSRPEEMFARAFECYTEDTMRKKKRTNSYLVRRSNGDMEAPYPQGKQREAVVAAVGKLMEEVKQSGSLQKALFW